jgi:hypothetical protein
MSDRVKRRAFITLLGGAGRGVAARGACAGFCCKRRLRGAGSGSHCHAAKNQVGNECRQAIALGLESMVLDRYSRVH